MTGYAPLYLAVRPGSAISAEAAQLRKAAIVVVESAERSQARFGPKAAALSRVHMLATECGEPGWDGADAIPIDAAAVERVGELIRALPDDFPLPEFAPEPDGAISLDWIHSRFHLFSVSVGRSNRLSFAWLDGTDRGHGVARFDGATVPRKILEGIDGVINGGASVRVV